MPNKMSKSDFSFYLENDLYSVFDNSTNEVRHDLADFGLSVLGQVTYQHP